MLYSSFESIFFFEINLKKTILGLIEIKKLKKKFYFFISKEKCVYLLNFFFTEFWCRKIKFEICY